MIEECSLGDAEATPIARMLMQNKSIEELELNGCLCSNDVLTSLDNLIEAKGAAALAKALRSNKELEELELNDNNIGDAGASSFANMLAVNSSLEELELTGLLYFHQNLDATLLSISRRGRRQFSLKIGNRIGDTGAASLARALKKNAKLEQLDLSNNPIGAEGVKAFVKALGVNAVLRDLKVSADSSNSTF